jgi:hypothetical protein
MNIKKTITAILLVLVLSTGLFLILKPSIIQANPSRSGGQKANLELHDAHEVPQNQLQFLGR